MYLDLHYHSSLLEKLLSFEQNVSLLYKVTEIGEVLN